VRGGAQEGACGGRCYEGACGQAAQEDEVLRRTPCASLLCHLLLPHRAGASRARIHLREGNEKEARVRVVRAYVARRGTSDISCAVSCA
jgi:hypothetical protein